MYLLVLALLGGDCVVPAAKAQKVIVEPQVAVQVDQFGNKRVVVQDFAHNLHSVYGYHDGSLAQQNAALTELLAENQRTMSALLISQQQFQQQMLAAGLATGISVQQTGTVPIHPGQIVFTNRCLTCHQGQSASGGVDLSDLTPELRLASLYQVCEGLMPKGVTLSDAEKKQLRDYLGGKR